MVGKTVNCGLVWDLAVSQSVDDSQQWVLSTMQRHGQELVTMLWRILGNEQDVCDAYQDTFLQLAHNQSRRRPEHIKAYIFRTAANTAVSMLRHRGAQRRLFRAVANSKVANPANDFQNGDTAGELDSRYLQETLRYHIGQLPEHLRNVITLHDMAELSYTQVAGMLGISAATARVYRCKAIQLLAVWMGREETRREDET